MNKRKLSIFLTLMITMTSVIPGRQNIANASSDSGLTITYSSATDEQDKSSSINTIVSVTPEASQSTQQLTEMEVTPSIAVNEPTLAPTQPEPSIPISPTMAPVEPTPTATPFPMQEATPSPTPPAVTIVPEPTATPTPTISPYKSKTLEKMASYNYVKNSVTGLSQKKVPVKTLQKNLKAYGTLYGTGMPLAEYKAAMNNKWIDVTEYGKKPVALSVNITKTINYNSYVNILKKLSRYDGVYLYQIGTSTEGRAIYAIEIDVESNVNKNVIMMTGQVHAREFAGGTYILKEFVDLVQKAQKDKSTMELLKKNKYVAVPIINVDGREALINSPSKWTYSGGQLLKAYTNGTDGNRNFPGLQWGLISKGSSISSSIATKPGYAFYPGKYGGSNSETKALMKWLYHYIIVEQASIYLDMHQQGSIIYAGKTWQTKAQAQRSLDLRTNVMNVLNKGITSRKYTRVYESSLYGLRGEGSSLTDYAITLAVGAKFSPAYGFHVFTDGKKEYTLLEVKDLDLAKGKFREANSKLAALTIEIGYGRKYLGNSPETRKLIANEYNYYNFGKLLEALPKMIK